MKYLPFLETERLIIRPITLEDTFEFFEMDSQPEVHTYLRDKPLKTIDEALNLLNSIRLQYRKFGIGRVAVIEKNTFRFIGWTGFKFIEESYNNHSKYLDFGYRLKKEAWDKGYATEAAKACIKYYEEALKHFKIHAMTHKNNEASRNVLQKVGFEISDEFILEGSNIKCYWYDLKKDSSL